MTDSTADSTPQEVVFLPITDIVIQDRARQEFDPTALGELTESLNEVGQLNPICVAEVEGKYLLDAGERRIKAADMAYQLGDSLAFHGNTMPEGTIACVVDKNPSDIQRLKKELAENVNREKFTWKEETALKKMIIQHEQAKINLTKGEVTKPKDISLASLAPEAMTKAIERVHDTVTRSNRATFKQDLELANAMEDDELREVIGKAKTKTEATKLLKKAQRREASKMLAEKVGESFKASKHQLLQGDCVQLLSEQPRNKYELCITDPIYGIGADKFGDSGGSMSNFSHDYDDSYETWLQLMPRFLEELTGVMKPHSHIYLACDMERFFELKKMIKKMSYPTTMQNGKHKKTPRADGKPWQVARLPIIQLKTNGRVPIPDFSYRRSYECWLYARIGQKQTEALVADTVKSQSPGSSAHGAVKGAGVYNTFFRVSGIPGQPIIDPFMGSGSCIEPAHDASMIYTGMEIDAGSFGEATKTLKEVQKKHREK